MELDDYNFSMRYSLEKQIGLFLFNHLVFQHLLDVYKKQLGFSEGLDSQIFNEQIYNGFQ